MHWSELLPTDQIFTHVAKDGSGETTFAASALRRYCDNRPYASTHAMIPLTEADSVLIMKKRGIERPRLRRAQQTKNYLPLLFIDWGDGTHLLIDGSHTYVAQYMAGLRLSRAYLVARHIWRNFLVEGLPPIGTEEELLNSYSGIAT